MTSMQAYAIIKLDSCLGLLLKCIRVSRGYKKMVFRSKEEVTAFIEHAMAYFSQYMKESYGIKTESMDILEEAHKTCVVRSITSLLYVKEDSKVLVMMSFERILIERLFEGFANGLDIETDEKEECLQETAGDMINIVVGRVLEKIDFLEKPLYFTPPIVIDEAKSFYRKSESSVVKGIIRTVNGNVICCIYPKNIYMKTEECV